MNDKQLFCEKNGKLHVGHTILTGFAFLASSIVFKIIGVAITAMIASMTITASNSIRVKPFLFIIK